MSRHRSVRGLNYDEEYDDYYCDAYGHSVEDSANFCASPGFEQQYMFDRSKSTAMGDYIVGTNPDEEDDDDDDSDGKDKAMSRRRLDSVHVEFPSNLSPTSEARLKECLEVLRDISGESIPEPFLLNAAIEANYDSNIALQILHDKPRNTEGPSIDIVREGSDASLDDLKAKLETICREDKSARPKVLDKLAPSTSRTASSSKSGSSCSTPRMIISPSPSLSKPSPRESHKAKLDPVAEYEKERKSSQKQCLNMVVIGHVDAGKSTLMGHLLFKMGQVNQKTMHKYEQESKKVGKQSFAFAWVLDETGEERTRGITMDVGLSKFETKTKSVTLLDAPGHKDFIPNMITGASQADVALLVVDATRGEFETGFESGGQTREHALLARSLGVLQMGVVVNKLDNEGWSKQRFEEISHKISAFLTKHVGLRDADVVYIPCSGLTGENLISPPTNDALKSWYSGPCLVDVIEKFRPPERPVSKPLRLSVTDVFKGVSSLVNVSGKVECGFVQAGERLLIMPQAEQCILKAVACENASSGMTAFAGDQVVASLAGIEAQNVSLGSVLCEPQCPVPVATRFVARLVVFGIEIPITRGFPVIFHQNSMSEQAMVVKLIASVHRSTGEILKNKPRCLLKNSSALVVLEVARPICIELYKDVKELGRFTLRCSGATIAAGMITEIL
ncbi:unnamed protein product [Notodromas monacha]|uniref:Tr-type G domain-containing protein n=1 Tax=Notodromas monacha TaxID=399045 RepID=A0A7R9BUZ9_9CRUS|nr:unnamed protein product [Notodromas monacha]CAG0920627.1 unnamed protein product [Notodromas monacha]